MMSGVKHQAPFGIACFRAPACGDGANGSGALHALLLPIVRRLCVISYRPPLRVRLALGECYAERRPPDLPGFVRRRRPRTVFARGPAIGEVLRDLRSESDVRAATCSPRHWFRIWKLLRGVCRCREGRALPAEERRFP